MSAKEIKALIEVGTCLGYSGEELKQFITEDIDANYWQTRSVARPLCDSRAACTAN